MPMEADIIAATNIPAQAEGESRQKFLKRAAKAIDALPEQEWSELSTDIQNWSNSASEAIEAKAPIDDFEEAEKPAKAEKGKGKGKAEKPAKAEKGKPAKAEKGKAAKKEPKEPKTPKASPMNEARRFMVKARGEATKEQVQEHLNKKSMAISEATLNTVYTHAKVVIQIALELGVIEKA